MESNIIKQDDADPSCLLDRTYSNLEHFMYMVVTFHQEPAQSQREDREVAFKWQFVMDIIQRLQQILAQHPTVLGGCARTPHDRKSKLNIYLNI